MVVGSGEPSKLTELDDDGVMDGDGCERRDKSCQVDSHSETVQTRAARNKSLSCSCSCSAQLLASTCRVN